MSSWLRSHTWKQSWTARVLSASSLPPPRLLAFFAIVIFFLTVSSYVDYKAVERRAEIAARVFAAPLATMAVFVLFAVLRFRRRYWTLRPRALTAVHVQRPEPVHHLRDGGSGSPPWGVALMVALLLLLVSFQSSVHSMWLRPLRGSDYYS